MNSSSKRLEDITYFIDRSLGGKIVAAKLRESGLSVVAHDEYFPQNCPDEEWLRIVGSRGWIVLTRDTRIRTRSLEIQAFAEANVLGFVLTAKNLSGEGTARAFQLAVSRMQQAALDETRPAMFAVDRNGRVTKLRTLA